VSRYYSNQLDVQNSVLIFSGRNIVTSPKGMAI
jgi:hypothetical protein